MREIKATATRGQRGTPRKRRVEPHGRHGGTTSQLVGGKFANGAITAAFATAFNEGLHQDATSGDESDGVEDSFSVGLSTKLNERLGIGISVTKDGAQGTLTLPAGKNFSLTVNEDGIGKVTVGKVEFNVNDKNFLEGVGVNIGKINLTGRILGSGEIQFSGRVTVPIFGGKIGLRLGLTRTINVKSALLNNSGGLGQAARAISNGPQRTDRIVCEASGGVDC